ncbi:MAG: hypothetical protein C5B60_08925 [Chloroflexi bacterium]|nr:MAG: hypothetical protein C5B60_08925 [Chloroflexota bacterium]
MPSNIEVWKLIAAIGGVLITVVTGPIIWAVRAEFGKLRAEMKTLRAELGKDIVEMESRLNQRIDTKLIHR